MLCEGHGTPGIRKARSRALSVANRFGGAELWVALECVLFWGAQAAFPSNFLNPSPAVSFLDYSPGVFLFEWPLSIERWGRPLQKYKQKEVALPIWLCHGRGVVGRFCFQAWNPEHFIAKWHLPLHLTPYHPLLILWDSVDLNVMFFNWRLYEASFINWVVKLILQEAPEVIMILKQYYVHSGASVLYMGK